jgi:hypothetical protein
VKLKLSAEQIRNILEVEPPDFPKYTTQLLNLANQNAQGTRPSVVGQLSDLIQQFKGKDLEEWELWYLEKHPDAIQKATERILLMLKNLRDGEDIAIGGKAILMKIDEEFKVFVLSAAKKINSPKIKARLIAIFVLENL